MYANRDHTMYRVVSILCTVVLQIVVKYPEMSIPHSSGHMYNILWLCDVDLYIMHVCNTYDPQHKYFMEVYIFSVASEGYSTPVNTYHGRELPFYTPFRISRCIMDEGEEEGDSFSLPFEAYQI